MIALVVAAVVVAAAPDAWSPPRDGAASGVFAAAQLFSVGDAVFAGAEPDAVLPRFELSRAEVGGGFVFDRVAALVVRTEVVRSAGPQSAFGIDGDSFVPRLKLAYAQGRPSFVVADAAVVVEARAGMIPSPWLSRVERHLGTRGLAPLESERRTLFVPSDLGASLAVTVADVVELGVSVDNGEGNNEVEQNAGKNVTAVVDVGGPVARVFDDDVVVGGLGLYRDGSVGRGAARDHRAAAALYATHRLAHVVVEGVYGLGHAGRADDEPVLFDVAADVAIVPEVFGIAARYGIGTDDRNVDDSWTQRTTVAVFSDFGLHLRDSRALRRLRAWAGAHIDVADDNAGLARDDVVVFVSIEAAGATDVVELFSSGAHP
jgi:hypothetical protein